MPARAAAEGACARGLQLVQSLRGTITASCTGDAVLDKMLQRKPWGGLSPIPLSFGTIRAAATTTCFQIQGLMHNSDPQTKILARELAY